MSEVFDTHQVWLHPVTGGFMVGGLVYYGKPNTDPTILANQISLFSDRALSIAISNPQTIGADGREENKVWLNERFSREVYDSDNVLRFSSPDTGENASTGATLELSNVIGINAITADTPGGITEYDDLQVFIMRTVAANTGNMTIDIDGVGPKSLKFNLKEEIPPGVIQANQNITFSFNATEDSFSWIDSGRGISILTNVAGDGNTITADGGPSISEYVDQQQYSFKPNADNSGDATLKVGTLPAHSIKNKGGELTPGSLVANIPALATYNSIGTIFELLSFTSGLRAFTTFENSGTWTRNGGTKSALIICIGGGGGGAGTSASNVASGGGGSGGLSAILATAFTGGTDTVTIGAGGAAGADQANGGNGGVTSVGTLCIANGGAGSNAGSSGGAGALVAGAVGSLKIGGARGDTASSASSSETFAGGSGAGIWGTGGPGGAGAGGVNGAPGVTPGSGGGGGAGGVNPHTGGAGKKGIVMILEFG